MNDALQLFWEKRLPFLLFLACGFVVALLSANSRCLTAFSPGSRLSNAEPSYLKSQQQPPPLDLAPYGCNATIPGNKTLVHFIKSTSKFPRPLSNCGIEAALHFSDPETHTIIVWTDNATELFPTELFPWLSSDLAGPDRFLVCPIVIDRFIAGTPLQPWYKEWFSKQTEDVATKLADIFRMAVIWHLGGMYTDTDMIALTPGMFHTNCNFESHWFGADIEKDYLFDQAWINNAYIYTPRPYNPAIWLLMEGAEEGATGNEWGAVGPDLFGKVLQPLLKSQSNLMHDVVLCPVLAHAPLTGNNRDILNGTQYAPSLDGMLKAGIWSVHFYTSGWYNRDYNTGGCIASKSLFHKLLGHSCPAFLDGNYDQVMCT